MAQLNIKARNTLTTHEGAPAHIATMDPLTQLRRSVLSCLLWEDNFYEDGVEIATRISDNALRVKPEELKALAIEARSAFNLRHVPLLLAETLTRHPHGAKFVADTLTTIIQRADELAEFVAIYTHGGDRRKATKGQGRTFTRQTRIGLQRAFAKFDEFRLAKYDRDGVVKLRDVLKIARPKPANDEQSALLKAVRDRTLTVPDTWEIELTKGADKKETFTRLIQERKLGYLALLRNLRNMAKAGVDDILVREAILARRGGAERVLPFRFTAAARAAPQYEDVLDVSLKSTIDQMSPLSGLTLVLVDVSQSMEWALSSRSDINRMDAAATLASIIPGQRRVLTFSNRTVEVPARTGMAGVDAIIKSQEHSGTDLGGAVRHVNTMAHDRLIVITDEQSQSRVPDPVAGKAYMINVASHQNGVGYGRWTHIDGFSEAVLRFIQETENAA